MKIDSKYFISASELLNSKNVPSYDFHIHTNYTDGKLSIQQVVEKAIEINLETIIFTEHTEPWKSKYTPWVTDYCDEIKSLKQIYESKIKIFIGFEANALNFEGKVELTSEMKKEADFILGAAHRYPELGNKKVSELSNNEAIDYEYKTLMGLAGGTEIDAIAHIGATCTKYCTPFPDSLKREIIKKAVKNNIAIEINPVYHSPLLKFLELCADENAMITLGSNAHGYGDIGLITRELKKILA